MSVHIWDSLFWDLFILQNLKKTWPTQYLQTLSVVWKSTSFLLKIRANRVYRLCFANSALSERRICNLINLEFRFCEKPLSDCHCASVWPLKIGLLSLLTEIRLQRILGTGESATRFGAEIIAGINHVNYNQNNSLNALAGEISKPEINFNVLQGQAYVSEIERKFSKQKEKQD